MARLAGLSMVHERGFRSRPGDSPASSMPVCVPKPKSRSAWNCSGGVRRVLNLAMPMLLETRMTSASDSSLFGCTSSIARPLST